MVWKPVAPLQNALAAATFYIVRPKASRVLPGYLAWWLNLPRVQAEIDASPRGTSIAYIDREALETLHVPAPPLSVQQRIEQVVGLWRKKKSLQVLEHVAAFANALKEGRALYRP